MTKFKGKPYAGKPHVRFDEGATGLLPRTLLYRDILVASVASNFFIHFTQRPQRRRNGRNVRTRSARSLTM